MNVLPAQTCGVVVALLVAIAASSRGAMVEFKQVSVDFTNAATATNEATWSESLENFGARAQERLTVTTNGLGWDGEAASSRDGWFKTKPVAVGLSWRTPIAVTVHATIQPLPAEFTTGYGKKATPYVGDVYVRYSPDYHHWSSWQALQAGAHPSSWQMLPQTAAENKNPGRQFSGLVRVPYSARERYGKLLSEYSRLDVPWTSDEEAAARWAVSREPDFFSKELPFIGYLEFLYEGNFHGGQRIRSFRADISYGMSGIAAIAKDPSVEKDRHAMPWRFKADGATTTASSVEQFLADFNSIKVGMTRGEVAKKLKLDGGLQSASPVRFVHPDSPFLKVDVEFDFKRNAADQNRAITSGADKVIHVSKPYLEPPFMD